MTALGSALAGCADQKATGGSKDSSADGSQAASPTSASSGAQPRTESPLDWKSRESALMTRHVQVTSRTKFIKAGEQYFNPDATWIIFQGIAVPKSDLDKPSSFYAMYVAKLLRDAQGHITGTEEPICVSPPMSANTCGWFHPTDPARIMYGSTIGEPAQDEKAGFQVGTNRYRWAFPSEMDVVTQTVRPIVLSLNREHQAHCGTDYLANPLFHREGYDAECSWDKTGRFVLYVNVDAAKTTPDGRADADIYLYDTRTTKHLPLVVAPGYDGGPFFSPDGKSICYRSDRKGNDLLQLYIADLRFETGDDGTAIPTGIAREYQVTSNESVNWAPYWHPSGAFLVYGTSRMGHSNYEVFAVEIDRSKLAEGKADQLRHRRITFAEGADVLPTFSNDGQLVMWTSQRGPKSPNEDRGSSQIWIAEWNGQPFGKDWQE
ncbi:MAG: PD40 domain-containing protein [Phycisphaerales bacterium]|nr:PD40 domain-containing protein [Phycisphaerales bacterium]